MLTVMISECDSLEKKTTPTSSPNKMENEANFLYQKKGEKGTKGTQFTYFFRGQAEQKMDKTQGAKQLELNRVVKSG